MKPPIAEWPPETEEAPPARSGKSLGELVHYHGDDPDELLARRFLCRGGGLLIVGPTGIGKSSFSMQAMMLWSLGRTHFGIRPAKPVKSLLIQAENDDGDLAEMRDGVIAGLNLTETERESALKNIIVAREDSRTSVAFFVETVRPLLEKYRPDMLWIDPALSFLGGEANSQREVGGFLRNLLNPLLREFGCAVVVVHHTNKPPSGREKPNWAAGDFAYLGGGSAEWANWARAILAIRSVGSHDVFELRAAKRGGRLGWRAMDDTISFTKSIAHSKEPGAICWRELSPDEADTGGRPRTFDADEVLALLPPEGMTAGEWQQAALRECGVKEATFHRHRRCLAQSDRVLRSKVSGKWQPIIKA